MKTYQGIQTMNIPKSNIQAIMFKKDKFTRRRADVWLRRHNYERIKPFDETINYLRARLKPVNYKKDYRIIKFGQDIKVVLEIQKL